MANLDHTQIGSVILNMIQDVPSAISGATLHNMIDQEIYNAENFTGDTIGASVADRYQPAIFSLAAASVVRMMEMQGLGTKSVRIVDMSITKGISEEASKDLRKDGMAKLEKLGEKLSFYKSLG